LGSGNYKLPGYKNIDIDLSLNPDECYDISKGLREEINSVDEILISHTLMYFTPQVTKYILQDCQRVLKEYGKIRITEDNRHIKIRNEAQQKQYGRGILFDINEMTEILRESGFVDIQESKPFDETRQHLRLSINYPFAAGLASMYFLQAEKITRTGPSVYLGLDDFCEFNTQMDILWRLRHYFDDFKVNLFAVPAQCLTLSWLAYISGLNWIRLCVHGYNHIHNEDLDVITLKALTDMRTNFFHKIYKAPYWELTPRMSEKLFNLKFKVITKEMMDWEIDKSLPDKKLINATGHIYPHDYLSVNGNKGSSLIHFFENIKQLPKGTKFRLYETDNRAF